MSNVSTVVERDLFMNVEVSDPHGHRSVVLEGLRQSTTMAEVNARAMSELRLPSEVDWNLRHENSGRLLHEEQRLGEFADRNTLVRLTMQPDAGLG